MGDEIKLAKDVLALILSAIALGGIIGSALITRYKTKKLIDGEESRKKIIEEIEGKINSLTGRLEKIEESKKYLANKSDIDLLKERITTNEKTMNTMKEDLQRQTELGTEIRIEIGSMHAELKNVAQLLQDLKSFAIQPPQNPKTSQSN